MKLEAFQRVYQDLWFKGKVAKKGSEWHRDNQYSYTMYLTNKHNSNMRLDQWENKGMLEPKYEQADELADLELPPPTSDFSVLNFFCQQTCSGPYYNKSRLLDRKQPKRIRSSAESFWPQEIKQSSVV